ncbi:Ig-like domain-containing protein [Acetobacterium tundrae]|nr:Ig domain-containing protein [Acetobacterium tundrae]
MKKLIFSIISALIMTVMVVSPGAFAAGEESQNSDVFSANQGIAISDPESVGVTYRTHIQNSGWENSWAADGNPAGTEGQSLRLEGIEIKLAGDNLPAGAHIEYRTHIQNSGWENAWTSEGNIAGTVGQSLRLEAIQIRLVDMPGYSVEYRTHIQNRGWETDWASDGESAGTEGQSLRLEAIEIRMVRVVPAPDGLTAKAASHGISLSWNGVEGADSYTVDQATSIDGDYTEAVTGITATNYTVPNLADGKRYFYKVKATDEGINSQLSEAATAIASVDDQGNVLLGNRLLISNQSTDFENTQSIGSLVPSAAVMETGAQQQSADFVDATVPFEPAVGQKPIDPVTAPNLLASAVDEQDSTQDFHTWNYETGGNDLTNARLAYIGTHSEIWVETDTPDNIMMVITDEEARQLGEEFDNNIYPLVRENFYTESDVNGDGRVAILCYNIVQELNSVDPTIGGYFSAEDLYDTEFSNKREMFYLDTLPTMGVGDSNPDFTIVYGLLAHEFQHMVNYNCNVIVEGNEQGLWLNEALSEAAGYMYEVSSDLGDETVHANRIMEYNESEAVRNGKSLFYWDNSDMIPNYALSFLFSQYLRTQADAALGSGQKVKVFHEILADPGNDYESVENFIQKHIDPGMTLGEFITNFRAAMVLKADSGYFGFNGEAFFDAISTPLYTGGTTGLRGGGAIVTTIDSPFTVPADKGSDVSYLGIFR